MQRVRGHGEAIFSVFLDLCSAWEHYDVEDEMKKIEKAEEEEQRLKNEVNLKQSS